MALGTIAKGLNHRWQDIVPVLHLDGQNGEADAELHANGLGSNRKLLEKHKYLGSQGWKFVRGDLSGEIIGNLRLVSILFGRISRVGIYLSTKRDGGKQGSFWFGFGLQNANNSTPRCFLR